MSGRRNIHFRNNHAGTPRAGSARPPRQPWPRAAPPAAPATAPARRRRPCGPRGRAAAQARFRSSAALSGGVRRDRRRNLREGSFSAVSKPNFASEYAYESPRRDLHNLLVQLFYTLSYTSYGSSKISARNQAENEHASLKKRENNFARFQRAEASCGTKDMAPGLLRARTR